MQGGLASPGLLAMTRLGGLVQLDDVRVHLDDGSDTAHEQMLSICRRSLPGWERVSIGDVQVCPCDDEMTLLLHSYCSTHWSLISRAPADKHSQWWHYQYQRQAGAEARFRTCTCDVQGVWALHRPGDRQSVRKDRGHSFGDKGFGPRVR